MTELEVRSKLQGLSHGVVAPGLEHHHGDWLSGESVTDDQLSENIKAQLLVGDSLDHANGYYVHECCTI